MVLAIVIIVLILSWAIEQGKADQWRNERLKGKPNYTNTYLDYFGMERDRKTNEPRFFGTDMSGDRVMYDKNRKVIKNLSKSVEEDKVKSQIVKAKGRGQRAIELDFLPSELHEINLAFSAKKKYQDVKTKANYIVIEGDLKRGMNLAHYYYDYKAKKVICPTDGFAKRFNDSSMCAVRNTRSVHSANLTWDDVLAEIPKLQKDIDANGLNWMNVCDKDMDYFKYFVKGNG